MGGLSSQESSSSSRVWKPQKEFLKDTYGQAQSLFESQGNLQDEAEGVLGQYLPQADEAYSGRIGDFRASDSILSGDNLGMNTLSNLQQGGINPHLQGYFDAANSAVNRNLTRNILPGIESTAQMAGQYGGTRQGIAEGIALSDANQQATDLASTMFGQAYDADQNRQLSAAGSYIQTGLGAQGQAATQGGNTINAANSLYNLGMDPYNRAWQPLQNYSNIVGGPTILSDASSSGNAWNIL